MTQQQDHIRVLVVDDDELVCRTVVRLLRRQGHEVHTATSLDAALGTVVSVPLDVALVDLCIGRSDGRTVIEGLRRTAPSLPAVLMSGGAAPELDPDIPFLAKPFTVAELIQTVKRATTRPPPAD